MPGAQLAVLDGDEIVESAAGVLSLRTGCPTTADALFLPGSIGKLYTATLVLMLVQDGRLDLDTPIRAYLPEFRVQDEQAAAVVDAPEPALPHQWLRRRPLHRHRTRRRRAGALRGRLRRPAADRSAGPDLELQQQRLLDPRPDRRGARGATFEDVLKERIFEPLALEHTVSFADEAIVHPVSVGHDPDQETERLAVSSPWGSRARVRPDGGGRHRQRGGRAPLRSAAPRRERRAKLLEANLVSAMQEEQVRLVDDLLGHAWGLGWILDRWGEIDVIGHDGNSIGQNAFMRVAPGERFGFCLQTNVGSALLLYRELASWLFGERFGAGVGPEP